MKLPIIPLDKANHFIYGSIVALVSLAFLPTIAAFLVVVAVAIGKEMIDAFGFGTPDPVDAIVTVVGGLIPICATVLPLRWSLL